jgi:hypothetical protein
MTISNRRAFEEFRSTQHRGRFNWGLLSVVAACVAFWILVALGVIYGLMK